MLIFLGGKNEILGPGFIKNVFQILADRANDFNHSSSHHTLNRTLKNFTQISVKKLSNLPSSISLSLELFSQTAVILAKMLQIYEFIRYQNIFTFSQNKFVFNKI